jgi:hypothetical protein
MYVGKHLADCLSSGYDTVQNSSITIGQLELALPGQFTDCVDSSYSMPPFLDVMQAPKKLDWQPPFRVRCALASVMTG